MRLGRAVFRTTAVAVAIGVIWSLAPAPTAGQEYTRYGYGHDEARWLGATWVDELGFTAINAVVSGVMGALTAALRDQGSVSEGFLQGSLGGAVVYGGKRLSAARFDGAGALGRVVTSTGASFIEEAGSGALPRRLVVPFGIVRLYYDRETRALEIRPDAIAMYWSMYGALHASLGFDLSRTLSAGAPVFVTEGGAQLDDAAGIMIGGAIVLDQAPRAVMEDVFAHERVHVAQLDHTYIGGGQGIEKWVAGSLGLGSIMTRVDVPLSPMSFFTPIGNRASNPFEVEADFLKVRSGRK